MKKVNEQCKNNNTVNTTWYNANKTNSDYTPCWKIQLKDVFGVLF